MKAFAALFLLLLTLSGTHALPRGSLAVVPNPTSNSEVATLTISGTPYVFDSGGVNATNIGNYVDPGPLLGSGGASRFTERRIMVTNAALPLVRVYFDDDIAGTQNFHDVIVEYAAVAGVSTTQSDYPAYTFTLTQGGTTLYAADGVSHPQIPQQIWLTRWRIASVGGSGWDVASVNHRPITVTTAQLQTAKLIPTYDPTNLNAKATAAGTFTYTPETAGGMGPNFGITGANDWIGFLTNQTGYYVVTGTTTGGGLASVFAGAEGMGSAQIWYRDTSTNALIDCHAFPNATSTSAGSPSPNPLVYRAGLAGPTRIPPSTGTLLNYDEGHSPNIAMIPFLETGDPYYLEILQAQDVGDQMNGNYPSRYQQAGRYLAWPLRNLRNAIVATPPSGMPSWLLTQAQLINTMGDYFGAFSTNIAAGGHDVWTDFAYYTAQAVAPQEYTMAPWQGDMLAGVIAEMQLVSQSGLLSTAGASALTQWSTVAQTIVSNWVMPRISGTTTGYFRSEPTWYDSLIAPAVHNANTINIGDNTITVQNDVQCVANFFNIPYVGSWTALFPSSGTFPIWIGTFPTGVNWTVTTTGGSNTWAMTSPATATKLYNGSSPSPTCGPNTLYGQGAQSWADFFNIQTIYWQVTSPNNTTLNYAFYGPSSWDYVGYLLYATAVAQQAGITGADAATWLRPQIESYNSTQAINWATMLTP